MKRVALYTKNKMLHRRISLILDRIAEVDMIEADSHTASSLVLVDKESFPDIPFGVALPHSVSDGKITNLRIPHELLINLVENTEESARSLLLGTDCRTVSVSGRTVSLTEVEYKLLNVLLSHPSYVSREEILKEVWDGKKDIGVVNVYVHYLRTKLESGGDKIIISSRMEGYKIDERWRG